MRKHLFLSPVFFYHSLLTLELRIFDIKRFAVHDGPGIRTTVFLKGCPLACLWCHNPESQSMDLHRVKVEQKLNGKSMYREKTYGADMDVDELLQAVLRDRVFYEESGGGVTFSGGEPLMQTEALLPLLSACKKEGLHITLDTSGQASREDFDRVLKHVDLFLYDLKNMDAGLHRKHTGVDNLRILENADFLLERGASLTFRIPVVPGVNTSDGEREALRIFLEERAAHLEEIHLLPYHRIADHKYRMLGMEPPSREIVEPGEDSLEDWKDYFGQTGLKVCIGG